MSEAPQTVQTLSVAPTAAADRVDEPELAMLIRNADLASALKRLKD